MQETFKSYRELENGDQTPLFAVIAKVYRPEDGCVKLLVRWTDVGFEHYQDLTIYTPEQRVKVLVA